MPTYDYECLACGLIFEVRQSFSEDPLTVCDCVRQGKVQRLMGNPDFVVKGGGATPPPGRSSLSAGSKPSHSCSPYCRH